MGTLPTVGTDQATTGHPVAPVCMGSSFKGNCRGMAPPKNWLQARRKSVMKLDDRNLQESSKRNPSTDS